MASRAAIQNSLNKLRDITKVSSMYEVERFGKKGAKKQARIGGRIQQFGPLAAKAARIAGLKIGADILYESMQRVPIATGELARSGRLQVGNTNYAKGIITKLEQVKMFNPYSGKEENVTVHAETDIEIIKPIADSSVKPTQEDFNNFASRYFSINVSYHRSPKPKIPNMPAFVHENIDVHGGEPPAARLEGRGGKYLEEPFMKHFGRLKKEAQKQLSYAVKQGIV